LIIALPWQVYAFWRWPRISEIEYEYNLRHFTEVLSGHGGSVLYHWDQLTLLYWAGDIVPWIILFSFPVLFMRLENKAYRIGFITMVVVVYAFYTATATKMPAFCFIVCSIIYLSVGNLLDVAFEFIRERARWKWAYPAAAVCALGYAGYSGLDLYRIERQHTLISVEQSTYRVFRLNNVKTFKALDKMLPSRDYVVFNCRPFEEVMGMFYSDHLIYGFILNEDQYKMLKANGVKIAIFDGEHTIDALKNDPEVIKIRSTMWDPDFFGLPLTEK
jgi:hypothetical protein